MQYIPKHANTKINHSKYNENRTNSLQAKMKNGKLNTKHFYNQFAIIIFLL